MFKNKNKRKRGGKLEQTKPEEWGQVKFVPKVPKHPRPVHSVPAATPWKVFKDELVEKQREEDTTNTVDINSPEAKSMLKKREQNYRRMLITEKSKQQTTWKTFDTNEQNPKERAKDYKAKNGFLSSVDLQNFDSKKLNFKQNNTLRKILTKGATTRKGSLKSLVKHMKEKKNKRQ